MPNGNLKHEVKCPNCGEQRMVRSDVIARVLNQGRPLVCKPCHNRLRFDEHDHPRKGTGVKADQVLVRTRNSYYKAKQRCNLGARHHACYEKIEFKFNALQELIDCIGVRPDGLTLDRIDPLGNYEPGNVRWATMEQQCANRLPRGYWIKKESDKNG